MNHSREHADEWRSYYLLNSTTPIWNNNLRTLLHTILLTKIGYQLMSAVSLHQFLLAPPIRTLHAERYEVVVLYLQIGGRPKL